MIMKAGRKRSFDKQQVLDKAMRLFWENGYSGTSLSDLTARTGINKPSLYAAFGNKEELFKASMEHYSQQYGLPVLQKLLEPETAPLAKRLKAYMLATAQLVTDPHLPKGCMIVNSSCEAGSEAIPEEISKKLADIKKSHNDFFIDFFRKEQAQGRLNKKYDVTQITSYINAVIYGMGVLASSGAATKSLNDIVDIAVTNIFQ